MQVAGSRRSADWVTVSIWAENWSSSVCCERRMALSCFLSFCGISMIIIIVIINVNVGVINYVNNSFTNIIVVAVNKMNTICAEIMTVMIIMVITKYTI